MFRAALRLAHPAALVAAAIAVTACVSPAGAANPSPPATPVDKDAIVIRVDQEGGFVTPGTILGRLPVVLVTADGRVITQGPQVEIYPGPLLPTLEVRTLTPAALASLVELARTSGLLTNASYDVVGIADATTTVLTITADGVTTRVSAYALGDGLDAGLPMDETTTNGRAAVRDFIAALTGLPDGSYVDAGSAFVPTGMRLYASPAVVVPDSELPGEQPAVDWPLGDLGSAGAPVGNGDLGYRCQVVAGDDLATVMPVLAAANQLSTFRSGGELWSLVARPLLPGEAGC